MFVPSVALATVAAMLAALTTLTAALARRKR